MSKIEEKQPNLYLDIDGVIYPFASDRKMENALFQGTKKNYSPEMVDRLGSLSMNLVWCTTRSERVVPIIVDEIDGLRGGRQLTLIPPRGALSFIRRGIAVAFGYNEWDTDSMKPSIVLKLEAIIRDQRNDPTPFVWIDDEITEQEQLTVNAQLGDRPNLVVPTDRELGLTLPQLISIEEFADQYGQSATTNPR